MLLAYESKSQILLDSYWRKSENNLRKLEEVEEAEKVLKLEKSKHHRTGDII